MLHGWGASSLTFKRVISELKESFMVYALDLPGFGESEVLLPLDIDEVCEIVKGFVDILNIERPILIGHSYGGRVAISYASKYEVDKLVLVSSAGIKQKLKISKRLKVRIYKAFKKLHIPIKMGSKDYQDADNVKRIMLVKAVNRDLSVEMKKIEVPTLLVYGDKDNVTPLSLGYKINNNISNSSLVVMEGCGHFPYLERSSYFCLILMSFLVGETCD